MSEGELSRLPLGERHTALIQLRRRREVLVVAHLRTVVAILGRYTALIQLRRRREVLVVAHLRMVVAILGRCSCCYAPANGRSCHIRKVCVGHLAPTPSTKYVSLHTMGRNGTELPY